MKTLTLILSLALTFPAFADEDLPPPSGPSAAAPSAPANTKAPESGGGKKRSWYRGYGEYLASRSSRMGVPTEPTTKVITDGKRFDAAIGKRISLLSFEQSGDLTGWSFGVDGGMLASLTRYKRNSQLTFATNTFDGFFGAYLGHINESWLFLLRYAHLSAHLVDNSPDILTPRNYSQFWTEVIVGKTFPHPLITSRWELHLQGSVGVNSASTPRSKPPRAALGMSFGHALGDPDDLALLLTADALSAGVTGQDPTYAFFTGFGSLNRPGTTRRPYRFGLAHFIGSDYRNQYFFRKQKWTTFELSVEF